MKLFLGYLIAIFLLGVFLRRKRRSIYLFVLAFALFTSFGYFFFHQI
jgi:hypothetical protein